MTADFSMEFSGLKTGLAEVNSIEQKLRRVIAI